MFFALNVIVSDVNVVVVDAISKTYDFSVARRARNKGPITQLS